MATTQHQEGGEEAPSANSYSVGPDHFEQLRRNALSVTRSETSNLDVVVSVVSGDGDAAAAAESESTTTYGYCHIPYYFPFSFFPADKREPFPVQGPLEGATAIHLAMMHLNTGDGSVVPEVGGLNKRCPIKFTYELSDTEMWETTAVQGMVNQINRVSSKESSKPCAFLGAGRSAVTMPMSIISGVSGFPQMSGISTSSQLDDRSQYKYFSRLIPSDDGTAIPVILYLRDIIQTQDLAVILDNNSYSTAFLNSLLVAKAQYAPQMNIQSIDIPFNDVSSTDLETAVKFLKDTDCRYIFSITDGPKIWDRLMTEAHRQGISGPQYTWMHSDSLFAETIVDREFPLDSPLADAARGASMLAVQAGLKGAPVFDRFVQAFKNLSNHPEHVEYIQSKIPVYEDETDFPYLQAEDIFDAPDPGANAIFLYDAAIAMGLAACAAVQNNGDNNHDFELDGSIHYQHIVNTTFVGASGPTKINPETGTRDPSSALFQLINFVPTEPVNGTIRFEAVQSDIFQNGEWKSITPYIFGDGTSNIPPSLPQIEVNENHIPGSLRKTGLVFSAFIMVLSIVFGVWTILKRNSRVVCASQPIFLLFICSGVFLMGSSIIPLSIDDSIANQHICNVACMMTPWLFSMGFAITYAALFSKTWRINRIFHHFSMGRVKVTAKDVMAPFAALAIANALILALWTGLAPLKWEREIMLVDKFGQVIETQGRCQSDNMVPYVTSLGVINLSALLLAAFQAYQAREIALEYSEGSYIGRAIFLFLLACFYGIPVMAIAWDDVRARYFVLMALASVCSLSVLLLIFAPKVSHVEKTNKQGKLKKRFGGLAGGTGTTQISGLDFSGASSGGGSCLPHEDSSRAAGAKNGAPKVTGRPAWTGLSILDAPNLRAALKQENLDLREKYALLEGKLKKMEMYGPSSKEFMLTGRKSEDRLFGTSQIVDEDLSHA